MLIRGTALAHFPSLVAELGGDPMLLLSRAGIDATEVNDRNSFISYRNMVAAVESASAATSTPDFGRRLGRLQNIEILGPVGVAAKTAPTVSHAFDIFDNYLAAYSPAISATITEHDKPGLSMFEFQIRLPNPPMATQTIELSLGVALGVLRFLIDPLWRPVSVHLPHRPTTEPADYREYFGCPPKFSQRFAGFSIVTSDLDRSLSNDEVTHQAIVEYLESVVEEQSAGVAAAVKELVRRLLPTGAVSASIVARQFNMHHKTLQRRLRDEGTSLTNIVDSLRRETALRYLRDTDLTMLHIARELGYSEQSAFTRSCRRWFDCTPIELRSTVQ